MIRWKTSRGNLAVGVVLGVAFVVSSTGCIIRRGPPLPRTNRIRRSIERTPNLCVTNASHLISGLQGGEHPLAASERLRRIGGVVLYSQMLQREGCCNATI